MHIASAAARDNSLSHPRALLGVTQPLNISIQQLQYNSVVTMPMSYHPQRLPRFHCELSWTMDIIIFIISRIVSAGGHDGSWVSMWAMCGGQTRYGHNFSSDRCQSEINVTWEMNASTQPSPWTVSITGEQRLHPFEDKIDDTIHNTCVLSATRPCFAQFALLGSVLRTWNFADTQSHFYWIPGAGLPRIFELFE